MKQTQNTKQKTLEKSYRERQKNLISHISHLTSDPKGITLIALVITIIVMLILVAVTIRITAQGKLFNYAGNAVHDTENAMQNENEILNGKITVGGNTYNSIDEYIESTKPQEPSGWQDNGNGTFTEKKTGKTVKVGDFVKYNSPSTYDDDGTKGWRVLGVENGELLIMSDTNVLQKGLSGSEGFKNGASALDEACQVYKDDTYATSARSIRVEDINKITGYNPLCVGVRNPSSSQIANGTKYNNGKFDYGDKVKYEMKDGTLYYGLNLERSVSGGTFILPGEKVNITEQVEIENTYYTYYPTTLTSSDSSSEAIGISKTSAAYDMLFNDYKWQNEGYWLASPCFSAGNPYSRWCLRFVRSGYVTGVEFHNSSDEPIVAPAPAPGTPSGTKENNVRAVISLSINVQLVDGVQVEGKPDVMSYSILVNNE